MGKISGIWSWVMSLLIEEAARSAILALLMSLGISVVGWFKDVPIYYLLVGFVFVFGQSAIFFMRFQEWRDRNNPEDKLVFSDTRTSWAIGENNNVRFVLGVDLKNTAEFPIYFRVRSLRTSLGGLYPPNKGYEHKVVKVPADGFGFLDDHGIELGPLNSYVNSAVEGNIECSLEYGRSDDKMDHVLTIKKHIVGIFNNDGNFTSNWKDGPI